MAVASKKDIDKLNKSIESLMEKTKNGLTDKELCSIIRTAIRKSWMRHPTKLLKLNLAKEVDDDKTTRQKWKLKCERCVNYFKLTDIEVDHLKGEHKLTEPKDIEPFARSILDVSLDDLQILCKDCHQIKTYAERHDLTEQEAEITLGAISYEKRLSVEEQKELLKSFGFDDLSNAEKRRKALKEFVTNNLEGLKQ